MMLVDSLLGLVATLLHAALVLALAPLLTGYLDKCRARLAGRPGAPLIQPYRDLAKLLRKTPLVPDTATDYFSCWPLAAFAATAAAALLVPGFCLRMATAPLSDFVTFIGLIALARAATMLAGLETGFGFGGAGAGRAALFGIFATTAMLVLVLALVSIAGNATIDGIAVAFRGGHPGVSVSLGLALAAILLVALAETGRLPVDASGQPELAMVRPALLLEYSGRDLALFHYANMLSLLTWVCLIGTIFLPRGMADATDILSWPGGLVLWGAKLTAAAMALALFEVLAGKLRVFRVPEFLGGAILLGLLSGVFLLVATRPGG